MHLSEPVLQIGENVHIITRRLFPQDVRRHFAGEILAITNDLIRVEGYAFIYESSKDEYEKRPKKRTRVFSMSGAGHIVIVLPKSVQLDALHYRSINRRLVLTDGADFTLDINEFGSSS
jgi:hypothetical protein